MLGEPFAVGRTAEVFEWADDTVLKLFRPEMEHFEYEFTVCNAVYSAGIPSPKPVNLITHNGENGIVFERIYGNSMLQELESNPFHVITLGKRLGELHGTIHMQQSRRDISFLPTVHDVISNGIQAAKISEFVKEAALKQLQNLPHMDVLCHGDFHPGNVILGTAGDVVIDWMNAVRGNPVADVVRTRLLLTLDNLPSDQRLRTLFNLLRIPFFRGYWSGYTNVNRLDDSWKLWVLPLAVARISEDISTEKKGLFRLIEKYRRYERY